MSSGIRKKGARHTRKSERICRQNGETLAETRRLTSAATELCTEYGQNVRFPLFPIPRVRRLTADRKSYPQARRLSCRYAGMNLYRMNISTMLSKISRRLPSSTTREPVYVLSCHELSELKRQAHARFKRNPETASRRVANKRKLTGTHLYKNSAFRFGMQLALLPKRATGSSLSLQPA